MNHLNTAWAALQRGVVFRMSWPFQKGFYGLGRPGRGIGHAAGGAIAAYPGLASLSPRLGQIRPEAVCGRVW